MTLYPVAEAVVVALLVAGSAFWLFGALVPGASGAAQRASEAGCGSGGCASCSGCGVSRVRKPPSTGSIQTL